MGKGRLERQIDFVIEIDKLASVYRRTLLIDRSRNENDAEHSWRLGVMAMLLSEYAPGAIDVLRVMKMVLIHDLVEIDAGDTFCYDDAAAVGKAGRECAAADRIFAILPADQSRELRSLWEEFEAARTPEARFAAALDRLQPLLHNYYTEGAAWRAHGVTYEEVIKRNAHIADGAPRLWEFAKSLIDDASLKGWLPRRNR